jgi:hypothetical protein
MRNFQTNVVEKIKTHILCSITFLRKSVVYEIRRRNIVEQGRPQTAIWRMYLRLQIHTQYMQYLWLFLCISGCTNALRHFKVSRIKNRKRWSSSLILSRANFVHVYITSLFVCLFVFGATAPSGAGPPHSRGF